MKFHFLSAALVAVTLLPLTALHAQGGNPAPAFPGVPTADTSDSKDWIPLFDGHSLDGWVQRGGKAEYRVEDGMIVGKSVPNTANSFLCTTKDYQDFIFETEFKVDPGMNSGIQFRSLVFDKPTSVEWKGKTVKVPANRVHGYQYEIDPSARKWTGGIYEEGRRGWLEDLTKKPDAQAAFKLSEWNQCRIEARGGSIRTWVNGVPAGDLKDDMTLSGFFALQVHGVGSRVEPLQIRWRNIRLKPLATTAAPSETNKPVEK